MNIMKLSALAAAISLSYSVNAAETAITSFAGIEVGTIIDAASASTNAVVSTSSSDSDSASLEISAPSSFAGLKINPWTTPGVSYSNNWTGQKRFIVDVLNTSGEVLPLRVKISSAGNIPLYGDAGEDGKSKFNIPSQDGYQTIEVPIPETLPDGFDISKVNEINFFLTADPATAPLVFNVDNLRLSDTAEDEAPEPTPDPTPEIIVPADDEVVLLDFKTNFNIGDTVDGGTKTVNTVSDKYSSEGDQASWDIEFRTKYTPATIWSNKASWQVDWSAMTAFKMDVLNTSNAQGNFLIALISGDASNRVRYEQSFTVDADGQFHTLEFALTEDALPANFDLTNVTGIQINSHVDVAEGNFYFDSFRTKMGETVEPDPDPEPTPDPDPEPTPDPDPEPTPETDTVLVSFTSNFNIGDVIDASRADYNKVSAAHSSENDGASWEIEYTAGWQGTTMWSDKSKWSVDWSAQDYFKVDVLNTTGTATKIAIKLISFDGTVNKPSEHILDLAASDEFQTLKIDLSKMADGFNVANVIGFQSYLTQPTAGKYYYDNLRVSVADGGEVPDPSTDVKVIDFEDFAGQVLDSGSNSVNTVVQDSSYDTDGDDYVWELAIDGDKGFTLLTAATTDSSITSWDWTEQNALEFDVGIEATENVMLVAKVVTTGYTENGWANFDDYALAYYVPLSGTAVMNTDGSTTQRVTIPLDGTDGLLGGKFNSADVAGIQFSLESAPTDQVKLYIDNIAATDGAGEPTDPENPDPENPDPETPDPTDPPKYTDEGGSLGLFSLLMMPLLVLFRRRKS